MPALKVTQEVIGGDVVTRYNGNNPSRSGQAGGRPTTWGKKKKIIAWRKAQAWRQYQEKAYAEEYLDA